MRFLALQPKTMLSFDWNAPPSLPEARQQRTFVVVRFEPVGDRQTRVSIHHTGRGDGRQWDQAYGYFDKAWSRVLVNLQQRFDKGPQDWSEWLAQLKAMHEAEVQKAAAPKSGAAAAGVTATLATRPSAWAQCAGSATSSSQAPPPPRRARCPPGP